MANQLNIPKYEPVQEITTLEQCVIFLERFTFEKILEIHTAVTPTVGWVIRSEYRIEQREQSIKMFHEKEQMVDQVSLIVNSVLLNNSSTATMIQTATRCALRILEVKQYITKSIADLTNQIHEIRVYEMPDAIQHDKEMFANFQSE